MGDRHDAAPLWGSALSALGLGLSLALTACGGSAPPAESPADQVAAGGEEGAPSEASADDSSESSDTASNDDSSSNDDTSDEANDEGNPKNVLIREGTAFMLNHRDSDIGKAAEEKCEKSSKGDVAKKANCLSAAINKMDREGFLFDEDAGAWWYVRFGIVKGAKVEFNRVQIEVGEPSGKELVIKTTGQDKASRRKGKVASELKFEVPDEYTIILHDDSRGKLIFEPKMGLFSE